MNRVSVRGIGLAAAVVAVGSLAAGASAAASQPAQPLGAGSPAIAVDDAVLPLGSLPFYAPTELSSAHDARMSGLRARIEAAAAARLAATRVSTAKALAAQAAARKAQAAKAKASARAAAASTATRSYVRSLAPGSARALGAKMVAARGWSPAQFECVDNIWTRESNWEVHAYNPDGGAYGIPQAQPGGKMASAGSDWRNNAATQIAWGLGYIARTYGTPCQAWAFWQQHSWY